MKLIDTHAHIYVDEFDTDRMSVVQRALETGVETILMPAIDSSTFEAMMELEIQWPESCFSMIGVHPCSVKPGYETELELVERLLKQRSFKAIGETGLDFYWDKTNIELQYKSFKQQISWALEYDLPVVIHSRNSTEECINVVREMQQGKLKGVFHCFSGTEDQARQIMDLGFYLGIGGVVTFKNSGLDKVVAAVGLDRIVLETDAPYLAPVPFRGKRNEPGYLVLIAQKIADLYERPVEEIAEITSRNAGELFQLG